MKPSKARDREKGNTMKDSTKKVMELSANATNAAATAEHRAWHKVTRSKKYRDASKAEQESVIARVAMMNAKHAVEMAEKAVEIAETANAAKRANEALAYCKAKVESL